MSPMLIALIAMTLGALAIFAGILISATSREGEQRRRFVGNVIALCGAIVNLSSVLAILAQALWPHIQTLL